MTKKNLGLLFSLIIAFFINGNTQTTNTIDSLNIALSQATTDTTKAKVYAALSKEHKALDIDSATYFAHQGLLLSKENNFRYGLAELYACLGDIEVIKDSLDAAKAYYLKSMQYFNERGRKEDAAMIHLVVGNIYLAQDNYLSALNQYQKGVQIAEEIDLRSAMEHLLNNLGTLYNELNMLDKSLEFYQKALEIGKELQHTEAIMLGYRNIGNIYYNKNDYKTAEVYYQESLKLSMETNHKLGASRCYNSLGGLYLTQGQTDKALDYFKKSELALSELGLDYAGPKSVEFANTYSLIGRVYYNQNKYDKALSYLKKGFDLGEQTNQLGIIRDNAKGLSTLYQKLGNYKAAYHYQEIYTVYSDSLMNENVIKKVTQIEMQYAFDKQLREKELEQEKKDAQQKRRVLIFMMIAIVALFALIISMLLYFLQRGKVKRVELSKQNLQLEKEKLKKELEFKNKELATNVMYLLKKNQFIINTAEKINKAKLTFKADSRKFADEIIRELKSSSSENSWKEFEVRFQDVHSEFYTSLNKAYPGLTPNELKLCAFLKLNMSTKEIEAITYQSQHSILVARSRLRKKLGLERETNLVNFLSQF